MERIGFIGAGNMAEAFIRGIIASGVRLPGEITAADIRPERLEFLESEYSIRTTTDAGKVAGEASIVFLSVKPQNMAAVTEIISGKLPESTCVISIAAGITTDFLIEKLGDIPLIRTMPNTPATVGEGITAVYNRSADAKAIGSVMELLRAVGKTVLVEDEALLDVVTAVSGSGPAYFFLLMEEMSAAAQALGLPEETANALACQTALGAGKLATLSLESNETPAGLRRKVTSPGGTTEAAITHFQGKGFSAMVKEAVQRARDRSRELSSGT